VLRLPTIPCAVLPDRRPHPHEANPNKPGYMCHLMRRQVAIMMAVPGCCC